MKTPDDIAAKLLGVPYDQLDEQTRNVASHVARRISIARNTVQAYDDAATFGQRAAGTVALFGGSWIFIGIFAAMLAASQAPIILKSQNRHAEKDRLNAAHDYEVNLKAELEIMMLHEKKDLLRRNSGATC
jgi:uncharacterized membrane protein